MAGRFLFQRLASRMSYSRSRSLLLGAASSTSGSCTAAVAPVTLNNLLYGAFSTHPGRTIVPRLRAIHAYVLAAGPRYTGSTAKTIRSPTVITSNSSRMIPPFVDSVRGKHTSSYTKNENSLKLETSAIETTREAEKEARWAEQQAEWAAQRAALEAEWAAWRSERAADNASFDRFMRNMFYFWGFNIFLCILNEF